MSDSLGGLLIGGMLGGNLITGFFNSWLSITVETVTPTPTVTVTVTPTPTPTIGITPTPPVITPTPTPLPPSYGGGGSGGAVVVGRMTPPPANKDIKITLTVQGKKYVTYHKKDDKIVKIVINIVRIFNSVKERIQNITIRKPSKENKVNTIKVKKHDS